MKKNEIELTFLKDYLESKKGQKKVFKKSLAVYLVNDKVAEYSKKKVSKK